MKPCITLEGAVLTRGRAPLLDHVDFQFNEGERIGLIGRSGSGKSGMLKVLAGLAELEDGNLWCAPDARICYVPQSPEFDVGATVFEEIVRGLGSLSQLLAGYHLLTRKLADADADFDGLIEEMQPLQIQLETGGGWAAQERIETAMEFLHLKADTRAADLSVGARKRLALAQALVAQPDVLLLDEPSSHLDFPAIKWLEGMLKNYGGSVLLVTHDRSFLDEVTTRIVELEGGKLFSFPGNFAAYLRAKKQKLKNLADMDARFDRGLAQEELWVRQSFKARHTRIEGSAQRLEQLRRERDARRERLASAGQNTGGGDPAMVELDHIVKKLGARKIIDGFSCCIRHGDKIGLFGNGGAGKNALLKIIFGEMKPDSGSVKLGAEFGVAYSDRLHAQLDENATLVDTIGQDTDYIEFGGERKDVLAYLGDFLFSPERARSRIINLSVGERNRLLLALLFSRPSDMLVLNDPTSGLDIETQELLEELLGKHGGTVFMVSHDRTFLDNVATQMIVFDEDGRLMEYAGGYGDCFQAKKPAVVQQTPQRETAQAQHLPPAATHQIVTQRKHVRHLCHWRMAIIHKNMDKNDIFHGRTNDLSVDGASVFIHHNIFKVDEVVMLLAVPPLHVGQKETIIEIQCRMAYTILDSEESLFRIGLQFEGFKGDGKQMLTKILGSRAVPIF